MYCMKCGKEIKENQVFCDACLVVMDKYPVKSGTHIQIPLRPASTAGKPVSRKRILAPEEQVLRLRRSVKHLAIALFCSILVLCLTVTMLVRTIVTYQESASIGKNYNTVDADGS